jgi:hypothetical protein
VIRKDIRIQFCIECREPGAGSRNALHILAGGLKTKPFIAESHAGDKQPEFDLAVWSQTGVSAEK